MLEPFVTSDENVRFHACERRFSCDHSKGQWVLQLASSDADNRRVVRVKMGEWNLAGSDILAAAFRSMLAQASAGKIEWPTEIVSHLPTPALTADGAFRTALLAARTAKLYGALPAPLALTQHEAEQPPAVSPP